jgi:predicted Rossmann-fold nucleotide-binding protein
MIERVCVFCGSSTGREPLFAAAARELGALLARERLTLVYGGGHMGLMGVPTRRSRRAGGWWA